MPIIVNVFIERVLDRLIDVSRTIYVNTYCRSSCSNVVLQCMFQSDDDTLIKVMYLLQAGVCSSYMDAFFTSPPPT